MQGRISRWLSVIAALALAVVAFAFPGSSSAVSYDFGVCEGTQPLAEIDRECLELMQAFPSPTVVEIRHDFYSLNTYSFWKVDRDYAPVFNAPGGEVIRQYGQGFNFVRVINAEAVPGWVEIAGGAWMQREDVRYVPASFFRGVKVLDGLQNQFAWVLGDLFTSAYPGGRQDAENGRLLLRYNRVNIFAEALDDDGWRWYMVGPNQWIEQRMVAKPLIVERPEGVEGRWVAVDLYEQTLVAFEDDVPVYATLVATGLPGTDTNEGLFNVWAALPRDRMTGAVGAPNGWDLESVPWVMYFDGSISLHGTYWHDNFGYRRSRGCVNLSISDARWVFEWMQEAAGENGIDTAVLVYSSGEYRTSGAATK